MACKDMNRVIDDNPIYVRQWPASVALENLSEALGLMGSDFSFFVDGSYQFTDMLQVLHRSDSKRLVALLKKFAMAARVDGKELQEAQFNQYYSGEIFKIFKVFAFVAEVNYRDFFELGVPPAEPDQQEEQDESKDPQLPTPSLTP